jgi:hypothetical protein
MAVYTADVAHLDPRAVGVSAFTVDDALSILDEELFSGGPRPPVACVVEDVALGVGEGDWGVDLQGLMPADGAAAPAARRLRATQLGPEGLFEPEGCDTRARLRTDRRRCPGSGSRRTGAGGACATTG